jgi:hypothetical protein
VRCLLTTGPACVGPARVKLRASTPPESLLFRPLQWSYLQYSPYPYPCCARQRRSRSPLHSLHSAARHSLLQVPGRRCDGLHIRERLHAGESFRTALCLTASHPSPPTAFLCLLLLVYCKPPFNILSHVVRLAPGLRSFSVFLLPPSRPPSLPPSLLPPFSAFAGLTLTRGTFLQRHI